MTSSSRALRQCCPPGRRHRRQPRRRWAPAAKCERDRLMTRAHQRGGDRGPDEPGCASGQNTHGLSVPAACGDANFCTQAQRNHLIAWSASLTSFAAPSRSAMTFSLSSRSRGIGSLSTRFSSVSGRWNSQCSLTGRRARLVFRYGAVYSPRLCTRAFRNSRACSMSCQLGGFSSSIWTKSLYRRFKSSNRRSPLSPFLLDEFG